MHLEKQQARAEKFNRDLDNQVKFQDQIRDARFERRKAVEETKHMQL